MAGALCAAFGEPLMLNFTRKINLQRLQSTFESSSNIGRTAGGGLNRLPLSKEDKEMRDVFLGWLEEAKLDIRVDDMGNIYGRRPGRHKAAGAVMVGSHLDTQPMGGRFDGIMGVLAALEVIRTLNDFDIETERSIELVNFTAEEGGRFGVPMVGSGVVTGAMAKDFVLSLKDRNGISFAESLSDIAYVGDVENRFINHNIEYYVEAHIEQSSVLERKGKGVGVVTGIEGESRFNVLVKGQSTHAASSLVGRRDALMAASEMVLCIDSLKESIAGLSPTVGTFNVYPSLQTITASEVKFVYVLKHIDDSRIDRANEEIGTRLHEIARRKNVEVSLEEYWRTKSVAFDKSVVDLVEEGARAHERPYEILPSTAGHDATYVSSVAKTGMIFAPSVGGLSHCEEEFTADADIESVTNVLLYVIESLAQRAS